MNEGAQEKLPSATLPSATLLRMTAEIVSAYARNNPLPASELTSIISTVHGSFVSLDASADPAMGGDDADRLERRLRIRVVPEPRHRFSLQGPSRADPFVAWALSGIYAPS